MFFLLNPEFIDLANIAIQLTLWILCLLLPSAEVIGRLSHPPNIYKSAGDLTSGSQVYTASTLHREPSPHLNALTFSLKLFRGN